MSTPSQLFDQTLESLSSRFATSSIAEKLQQDPTYDRAFGERVCSVMHKICEQRRYPYEQAVHDFVNFCLDFLRLQAELEKTGRYSCSSWEDARKSVYDNPEVMSKKYLNGLFLSQAFWINHFRLLAYFWTRFCSDTPDAGTVMEVPTGTGIYISEFVNRNPAWVAKGYDLSASSVAFSRQVIGIHCVKTVPVEQYNVFDISATERYDRIICGELLEHLEKPRPLLEKLCELLDDEGKLFLTTAMWAASTDHVYLFESAQEVRDMLGEYFRIEHELVLNVDENKGPDDVRTPMNYAGVLTKA